MSYYVISKTYTGPNQDQDQYIDVDTIGIYNEPARGNMSGETITEGWCGTTNDWSVTSFGKFETLDRAQEVIELLHTHTREAELPEHDDTCIALYKPGQYEPLCLEATAALDYDWLKEDITSHSSDSDIKEHVATFASEANSEGYLIHPRYIDAVIEYRDELWLQETLKR